MLDSLILPPWLLFLCIVLIIFPTIACIFLRWTIYKHITNSAKTVRRLLKNGIQPRKVKKFKDRFEEASKNLEQVNTGALVDGIYSEETFSFLSFTLNCEQWDAFCRFLPNLLVSFGLLGTFFGITINLSSVSEIINQNNSNLENLLTQLQQPLQGMGIAFITSLIAIACSATLTLVNVRWNTSLAKEKLISSLEDYLDNVLHPTIEGHTRLDQAVNRMVDRQDEFLTRFHEKVGAVLESTLKPVADRIAAQNEKSHRLAEQVYEGMRDSSTTLLRGAENFERATSSLKEQVQKVTTENGKFAATCKRFEKGADIFASAAAIIEESKFSENLEKITQDLASAEEAFAQTVSRLDDNVKEIRAGNQRANELAKEVYSQFRKSSEMLHTSAITFSAASETILESEFPDRLLAATKTLDNTRQQFSESVSNLQSATKSIEGAIASLQNSTTEMVELAQKQVESLNKQSAKITEIMTQLQLQAENIAAFQYAVGELNQHNQQSLDDNIAQLQLQAENNIAAFQNAVGELNQNNQQFLTDITTQLQQGADNIAALGVSLERFNQNNQQSVREMTTQLQESNRSQVETIVQQLQDCTSNLLANQSELAKLIQILQQNRDGSENQDNSNSPKEDPDIRRIRDFVDL